MSLIGSCSQKIHRLNEFYTELSDPENILVYQMGKVGSTSLANSLEGSIHVHTMFGNEPCHVRASQKRCNFIKKLRGEFSDYVIRRAVKNREETKIITVVREPFSRGVSMFFRDLSHWFFRYDGEYGYDTRAEGIEILFEVFEKSYDHEYGLNWFDKEIKRLTKIDVYDYHFDKGLGWGIINKDNFKLLILKVEKSHQWQAAIREFCGKDLSISIENRSDKKWFSSVYKDFKKKYRPSEEYLNKLYSSKFVRHFYSNDEIDGFLDMYLKRAG